jgi:hypothetical protein
MKTLLFYIVCSILLAVPAWATSPTDTFREVLMQNAAVAVGNGTSVTVDYFTTISLEVTITNTATITWEESLSGGTWNTGTCVNANAPGTLLTTITVTGLYHCNLTTLTQVRARISAWTSGTVTAYARITKFDFNNNVMSSSFPSSMIVTQSTGTNLHIVCDSGCGGAASFTDNGAFTFGTTAINTMGAVVDDVATNAVTENSAGAPRMSTKRTLYAMPADTNGTALYPSAAVEADAIANPTLTQIGVFMHGYNGVTWDRLQVDASKFLKVNCATGCAGGATTPTDAFANPTTASLNMGFNMAWNGASWDRLQVDASKFLKVTIAGQSLAKVLVTPDSVALPANQSVNVSQIAGTNTVTGGVAGIIAVGGNVANAVAATANPVPVGGVFTTVPATLTTGQTATAQYTAAQNHKTDLTTIAGTAPTTAGKVDVKGADGDVFVRQATATNLNAAVVGTGTAGAPAGNILTIQGVGSMTKLLVTPDSVALPANQSVNVAQIAGTNTVTGGVAGIIAVGGNVANAVAATANPVPVGGTFITAPTTLTTGQTATLQFTAAQNVKTDMSTVAGTATSTAAAGIQKVGVSGATGVTLDAAQNAATPANNLAIGCNFTTAPASVTTGNLGAVQCNSKGEILSQLTDGTTNVAVIAGTTALKTDVSSVAGTATVNGGLAGSQSVGGTAANNAAINQNPVLMGCEALSTQPGAATTGNQRRCLVSLDGALYTREGGPIRFSCGVTAIGTTLTQCQAAPGAGLSLYITDVITQSNTATAGLFTLRFGTGANCGTGTGNLFFGSASALMASPANTVAVNHFHLSTPIVVTANNAVCVLGVVTNTTNAQINGYTAP